MKDNYKKAMEVWEVPEEFYEAAVPMYRGYEAELAVMFGRNPVSGQEICRLLKEWGKRSRRGCFSRVIREMYWKNARGTKAAAHFIK